MSFTPATIYFPLPLHLMVMISELKLQVKGFLGPITDVHFPEVLGLRE